MYVKVSKLECNGDGKSCTVLALAKAKQLPFYVAQALAAGLGRQPNNGFNFYTLAKAANLKEHKVQNWKAKSGFRRCRVDSFLRENPVGRFVVKVPGHVFAVIDGKVHDTMYQPMRIVRAVWEVV